MPKRFRFLRRFPRAMLLSAAVLVTCGATASEGSFESGLPPGYRMERSEQVVKLEAGQRVVVRNDFGDVRARFGGYAGDLEVLAVLQQFAQEGAPLDVRAQPRGNAVEIDVGYAGDDGTRVRQRTAGQRRRVDLVLLVPEGAALDVETSHGLIQARGLRHDLRARSDSGAIEVRSIQGDLDLATRGGDVFVALPEQPRESLQRIVSGSGDVRLMLAEDGHYAVRARGDGLTSTEFSLRFESGEDGTREARIDVGKALTPVRIEAGTGHVRIERKPSAVLAAGDDA